MSPNAVLERQPISVCSIGAELGEGPVQVERDQALWFTDISIK
jgi:xylono-1,5-lactonase